MPNLIGHLHLNCKCVDNIISCLKCYVQIPAFAGKTGKKISSFLSTIKFMFLLYANTNNVNIKHSHLPIMLNLIEHLHLSN